MSAEPSRIRPDDSPPSRKYFSPADVADSESRYSAARMYTANDWSSILRYIDTRSALEIKKLAPHVVNKIIREYSGIEAVEEFSALEEIRPAVLGAAFRGTRITKAAIVKINASIT